MRRLHWSLPLGGLSLALLLAGCSLFRGALQAAFEAPTLTFQSAQVRDVTLSGATVDVLYRVDNPNPVALSLAQVDYMVAVEGHPVLAGQPPAGLQIPASGSALLTFPATVRFSDIEPLVQTFLTRDVAHYKAEGHVGLQTPVGVVTFPLSHEGQFPVPKMPSVEVASPRVTALGFTSASLDVPLRVTNPNAFALPLRGITGTVLLGGYELGAVNSPDLGTLAAHATREVTLPVTVRFAQAARAAAALTQALGGAPTQVGFRGTVQSGGISLPLQLNQTVSLQR